LIKVRSMEAHLRQGYMPQNPQNPQNRYPLPNWSSDLVVKKRRYLYKTKVDRGRTIRVMTYNILADSLVEKTQATGETWESRSEKICKEIEILNPDILTINELDEADESIQTFLKSHGYECHYEGLEGQTRVDGTGTFWKSSLFERVDDIRLSFQWKEKFPLHPLLHKEQICNISILKNGDTHYLVASSHLLFNDRGDLKLLQVKFILQAIEQITSLYASKGIELRVVLTGDFNLSPDSALYTYMVRGSMDVGGIPKRSLSGQNRRHRKWLETRSEKFILTKYTQQNKFCLFEDLKSAVPNDNEWWVPILRHTNLVVEKDENGSFSHFDVTYNGPDLTIPKPKPKHAKKKRPKSDEEVSKEETLPDNHRQLQEQKVTEPEQDSESTLPQKSIKESSNTPDLNQTEEEKEDEQANEKQDSIFANNFTVKSAYAEIAKDMKKTSGPEDTGEPLYTHNNINTLITCDYIFYAGSLKCVGVVDTPRVSGLVKNPMPNALVPSDHLSLVADFLK